MKPDTKLEVGKLPEAYRPSSRINGKFYLIIPVLICGCLIWFGYNQWKNPPQIQKTPAHLEPKKRVWWMPDLLKTLPALADGYRNEKYLPKYNMTTCVIRGNFERITAAVNCYLYDTENFIKANKTISNDLEGQGFCGNSPPLSLNAWNEWKKYLTTPRRKLVIVQQPLERFVRQFKEFCERQKLCFDCGVDVKCFMRKLKMEHEKIAEGLDGSVRSYLTHTFSPQSWNCHFHRHLKEFDIIKVGGNMTEKAEYIDQLTSILDQQGVPNNMTENIRTEIDKIPMELTEEEAELYTLIRKDEDKFRLFRRLYEYDYLIFGFSIEI